MTATTAGAEPETDDRRTGVLWWLQHVLAWLVILFVGALIMLSVIVPRLCGATPYTILTGSMVPAMPPGTLVVMRPVPPERIGIGTVVTYQLTSGEPTVVTHRVVSVGVDGRGERVFRTQGDANDAPDAKPVLPVQIKGELWYAVPYAGYVNKIITGKERQVTMVAVVSGLLIYSGYMFASAWRERRLRGRSPRARDATRPTTGGR